MGKLLLFLNLIMSIIVIILGPFMFIYGVLGTTHLQAIDNIFIPNSTTLCAILGLSKVYSFSLFGILGFLKTLALIGIWEITDLGFINKKQLNLIASSYLAMMICLQLYAEYVNTGKINIRLFAAVNLSVSFSRLFIVILSRNNNELEDVVEKSKKSKIR